MIKLKLYITYFIGITIDKDINVHSWIKQISAGVLTNKWVLVYEYLVKDKILMPIIIIFTYLLLCSNYYSSVSDQVIYLFTLGILFIQHLNI